MTILVTGGAGYIGSFMVEKLLEKGYQVVVIDNLSRGHNETILKKVKFEKSDLLDFNTVSRVFAENKFEGVIHFAGYISMGESMDNPYLYFRNNLQSSLNVLEAMVKNNVNNIIFSSTAGVYGSPKVIPISEDHSKSPENPYGESKLMVERILKWYYKTKNISFAALRYFNASGASLNADMGENHDPETHIIPNIINSVLSGNKFKLFGSDYKTPDGTCIRDYIHVIDLAEAHILALERLFKEPKTYTYNVGTGKGYSNKEVIQMIEKIAGKKVFVENTPRRPGDADILIADVQKINKDLEFSPKYSDLQTIVETAWKWHSLNQK